ncbi:hypothetical protein GCM10027614_55200 [Micromonospora vulcania]
MGKTYEGGAPLAEVVRSGFVEGAHRGSVVVLDAAGVPLAAAGDVTGAVFPDRPASRCRRSGCSAPACP